MEGDFPWAEGSYGEVWVGVWDKGSGEKGGGEEIGKEKADAEKVSVGLTTSTPLTQFIVGSFEGASETWGPREGE